MRVGVIFAIYNCEEYVDKCLEPWFRLRGQDNFILTVTSGRFKDYIDLGIPNKNQSTLKKLANYEFDYMSVTGGNKLLDEDSSRNACLDFLKPYNCDIIWLVDGDEFYDITQIRNILDYVQSNPEQNNFSLYLKNYTINYPYFTGAWARPTLYRNNIYGGIGRFYFDSFFVYQDSIHNIETEGVHTIPRHVAFIEHLSWVSRDATKDKIIYQNSRYAGEEGCRCAFEWKDDRVIFSQTFWKCRGLQIPILSQYPSPVTSPFLFFDFVRSEDKITVKTEIPIYDLEFVIKDIDSEERINSFAMSLEPGPEYYMIPIVDRNYDQDPFFRGFRIEVYRPDKLIHVENLLLK